MSEERTLGRYGSPFLQAYIQRETWGFDSCLEFGFGVGAYTNSVLCPTIHGIELFASYYEEAKQREELKGVEFFLGDMRRFDEITSRDYDVALFIDTLEHITKEDALDLLGRCQKRFKKIILFIPIGEEFQGNQDWYDDNPAQKHLSTWNLDELTSMGFAGTYNATFHSHLPTGYQGAAFLTWVRP